MQGQCSQAPEIIQNWGWQSSRLLSPLPPPSSLIAPVTNTSLHDNSGNRREYYCKWCVCVYVCYIYAQKITPVVATHFWQTANQNQLPALKKKRGGVGFKFNSYNEKMHFSSSVFNFLLYLAKSNNVFIQTSSPYAQWFWSWAKPSV